MNEIEFRDSLKNLIEDYYKHKEQKGVMPGEDYISVSGKMVGKEEMKNLIDASVDLWLTAGHFAEEFENKFASYFSMNYCSLINSGSSANLLAMSSLTSNKLGEKALKAGDEIITVAAGFPTTIAPIIQNKLVPVFVDIDIPTYNVDVKKVEKALSDKTKAIFLAHTLGNPFDLEKISKIARENDLWLIEDNCDALGSRYNGKLTGTFGDLSTCSFYPAHQITMGEGGAVITNNQKIYRIVNSFRDWGRDCWCPTGKDDTCGKRFEQQFGDLPFGYDHKYVYTHLGYNLKNTDFQAAVGLAQLDKLESFIKERKQNFEILHNGLKEFENSIILPKATENSDPSWFGFPITIKEGASVKRIELLQYLEKNKIGTRLLFAGNILKQPVFTKNKFNYKIIDELKNTDFIMNNSFWIGLWPGLGKNHLEYVLDKFKKFLN